MNNQPTAFFPSRLTRRGPWPAAARGWRAAMTLIETSVVLIIVVAALTTGAVIYADYLKSQTAQTAAGQMIAVAQSFKKYVKDKYPTLVSEASPTGFYEVPMTALTAPAAGDPQYLPAGFSNKSPYSQSYHLMVRKPNAAVANIEALVYTDGGEQIPPDQALAIAQAIGASGGFTLRGGSATQVQVTDGTALDLTSFGVTPSAPGKLVSALFMGELDNDANDYLYRVEVPGHPELNTMSTNLNMGGNSVNNAYNVTATNQVTAGADVVAGNNVTASNNVTATNGSVTAGTDVTAGGNVRANGAWVWAQGQVIAQGRITTNEYLQLGGVATEGAACSPNGLVGRNTAGLLLSCQSGIWRPQATTIKTSWFRADAVGAGTIVVMGARKYCALTYSWYSWKEQAGGCYIYQSGSAYYLQAKGDPNVSGGTGVTCQATCFD